MRNLDIFRLPEPVAVLAHFGAGILNKSNFLVFLKILRKAADQAIYLHSNHCLWKAAK